MSWQLATILVGGVATLAVFSFLIKENSFFRFFEHLYIGIAAGFGTIVTIKDFLWPKILTPMLGLDIVQYPDGTFSGTRNYWYLLYLVPMFFGLLYYFLFSVRYAWLAKIVIGFTLGMSGGIALKAFFNEMMPQIFGSFKPLIVFTSTGTMNWGRSFSNSVFVVTLLCVMSYFFFSFRLRARATDSTVAKHGRTSILGRWLMMICFGAFFGSTVMARMALLVERLDFLIHDWSHAVVSLFT